MPARLVERVEGVEKFFLRAVLSRDKLNVVHEKNIRLAVFFPEFQIFSFADRADELVCELLALNVNNPVVLVIFAHRQGNAKEGAFCRARTHRK